MITSPNLWNYRAINTQCKQQRQLENRKDNSHNSHPDSHLPKIVQCKPTSPMYDAFSGRTSHTMKKRENLCQTKLIWLDSTVYKFRIGCNPIQICNPKIETYQKPPTRGQPPHKRLISNHTFQVAVSIVTSKKSILYGKTGSSQTKWETVFFLLRGYPLL